MTWSKAYSLLCAALVVTGLSAPALATDLGAFGGTGGTPFRDECAPGEYLVGLDGRTGAWLDAIGAVCARWNASSKSFVAPRVVRYHGALGGGPQRETCAFDLAIGTAMIDLKRSDDHLVANVTFECYSALPPYNSVSAYTFGNGGGFVPIGGRPSVMTLQKCPAGELAVGILGRSGDSVDAFGLICGPAPVDAPPPPAPPQASAPKIKFPLPVEATELKKVPSVLLPKGQQPAPDPTPAPAPTPTPAPAPPPAKDGAFDHPLTVGHERLNACLFLPNDDCGEPSASEYCQSNGYADVADFQVEKGNIRSETIYGELCRKNCRVFISVSCSR